MSELEIKDGEFYNVEATGPAIWESIKDGMKAGIPVKFENGETGEAVAMITSDEEKANKTRAALTSWGWNQATSWPTPGTPLRVVVKMKEYQGTQQRNLYVVAKGGAKAKPIEGTDLEKFLKNEKARASGVSSDPFGT